jgi:hypothetical protein
MSFKTFSQLIVACEQELSQTPGVGVQVYAEDVLGQKAQRIFNSIFDAFWLDGYCDWADWTLDGVNGVVTDDLTNVIEKLSDIRYLFIAGHSDAIPRLPTEMNPFTLTGVTPIYFDSISNPAKKFQIWPRTAIGGLQARIKVKPANFTGDEIVYADADLLTNGAVYDYLEDDGANPNATQKYKNLFDSRFLELRRLETSAPIKLAQKRRRPTGSFTIAGS